jgi:hypothetical protein
MEMPAFPGPEGGTLVTRLQNKGLLALTLDQSIREGQKMLDQLI